uniref:MADF domain-containing protein n=1 Tax=Lygus hesperus TaxID=30085 RepID=A0A0K8SBQ4_LYGHE
MSSSPPHNFVDSGKLIHMVRAHPVLYDVNHSQYKDNENKNDIWNRISSELGIDIETTKTKWRNLRDSYVKYLKCTKMKGASLRKYSRWPWAIKMEFLKPFLPAKLVKTDEDQDEAQDGYHDHVEHQENGEEEEEERKVFDILQIKRAKLHSPEDLMARRVSNMEAIDHLFLSYAQTMKTFSHKRQVMIKSQLATLMNQAELDEIAEQEDPLTSIQHHLDYEYN